MPKTARNELNHNKKISVNRKIKKIARKKVERNLQTLARAFVTHAPARLGQGK